MTPMDLIPAALTVLAGLIWIVINGKLQRDCMQLHPVYGFLAWFGAVLVGFVASWEIFLQ